jgi:hypothetical protein
MNKKDVNHLKELRQFNIMVLMLNKDWMTFELIGIARNGDVSDIQTIFTSEEIKKIGLW